MTVTLVGRIKTFVGLSTDKKPTDVPAGSTFYETDTRSEFIFNGRRYVAIERSVAKVIEGVANTNRALSGILTELRLISAHLEAIND